MSKIEKENQNYTPRYELSSYRQFIRDAAPYVSIVAGRRIRPTDAETIPESELLVLAKLIDARAEDLKKSK